MLLVKLSQAQEVFERIVEPVPRQRPDLDLIRPGEPVRAVRRPAARPLWFPQTAHPQHRTRGHH
ncbi:hypothetical protein [Kribbella sp. CA-293567]|uniref:hypothetical protein n=1 Tax=Kribbella sp. CA-293567 TaxID=3002436 RepID=UPI0022DDF753|nr:hypothetical protein [Kribbella sp. CA-293567]WBQ06271.1 hypothetical protein OX958_05600 [Kribbella sp. CA-293567]